MSIRVGVMLPRIRSSPTGALGLGGGPGGCHELFGDDLDTFVDRLDALGFAHVGVAEHVLGVDPATRPNWSLPWTVEDAFHDPFVLLGYVAARTRLDLLTSVLVLPQRQTLVVAKQAAELQLLSRGRLRLGVGVGRNFAEYEALGADFPTRGVRLEEQIALLRRMWSEKSVRFEGQFHRVDACGISPQPAAGIPVWIGGGAQPYTDQVVRSVLERVGRLADGWLCRLGGDPPIPRVELALRIIRDAADEAGRDGIGVEGSVDFSSSMSRDQIAAQIGYWETLGASHVSIYFHTPGESIRQLLDQVDAVAAAVRLA